MKKYVAELLGTFALTFAVFAAITHGGLWAPVAAMLTLGLFVYSIGHVSGCHINPAVTLGLFSLGKVSVQDMIAYIIAQFVGALLAVIIILDFLGGNPLALPVLNTSSVLIAEAVGMMLFTFGIASVVFGKATKSMRGVIIGGSLLLGIVVASIASNGILNPAVAFAIGSFNAMYLLGPIIGSVIGFHLYRVLCTDE